MVIYALCVCVFCVGFGSAVGILGSAATYIIGPKLVYAESGGLLDPYEMRIRIMRMLYTCTTV